MPAAPIGAEGAIAIVLPLTHGRPLPLSHPFFLELLANIGEAARDRGCDFTVSHTAPASYDDLYLAVTASRANGTIFLGQGDLHEAFNQLAATNARFVVWGAQLPGQKYCSIGSDNFLGGRRATLHLARLDRKKIVFLGEPTPKPPSAARVIWAPCARAAWSPSPRWCCPSISKWSRPKSPSAACWSHAS